MRDNETGQKKGQHVTIKNSLICKRALWPLMTFYVTANKKAQKQNG